LAATVCKNIDLFHLKAHASIGQAIDHRISTGSSRHFAHQIDRRPELIVGKRGHY
jgi:hypothetical protein